MCGAGNLKNDEIATMNNTTIMKPRNNDKYKK